MLFCSTICRRWVKRVGNSRRRCTLLERFHRHGSVAQRLRQNIGGGNCILHREIDTDPADRRHCVRCISYAEQSWPVPAP